MKASELIGSALDWAVAKCEGYECQFDYEVSGPWLVPQEGYLHDEKPLSTYNPSTNWAQGGPLIQRELLLVSAEGSPANPIWVSSLAHAKEVTYITGAAMRFCTQRGPAPLIAAMRCYVASKLGDEVELPAELI